jgi:hypothetical protein
MEVVRGGDDFLLGGQDTRFVIVYIRRRSSCKCLCTTIRSSLDGSSAVSTPLPFLGVVLHSYT